jgi:hypothetical protein
MRGRHSKVRRPATIAIWIAASSFALMAAWSLASPLYSGPDEPAHVIRAVSVAHGQIIGQTYEGQGNAQTLVVIPQVYSIGQLLKRCYRFRPEVPASCSPRIATSGGPVQALTYEGRYPPLYYLLVGWPSLLFTSGTGVYAMRLISALFSAFMLGLAIYAVRRWSRARALPLGILVALTPIATYLSGVVNPSGLEICAAICMWASGLVLFTENLDDPPIGLLVITTGSAAVLTSMRGLSPLWTVLILAAEVSLGSWRKTLRLVRTRRDVQICICILFAVALGATCWVVAYHALDLIPAGQQITPGSSNIHILSLSVRSATSWLPQMVGIFGSLDTSAPSWAIDIWYGAALAILIVGLLSGPARRRVVLVAIFVVGFGLSVLLQYSQARRVGLVWQGRYLLPILAGLPLVSATVLDRPERWRLVWRALTPVLAVSLFVATAAAFFQALRRYAVGATGALDLRGTWRPLGGQWSVIAIMLVATAGLTCGIVAACRSQGAPSESPAP